MDGFEDYIFKNDQLRRERDSYAKALKMANLAFMEKVSELVVLRRISGALAHGKDISLLCLELARLIIEETSAENCSLWLLSADRELLELTAAFGRQDEEPVYFPPDRRGRRMRSNVGVAGRVARTGVSQLIEDVTKSGLFEPMASGNPEVKSLLCLPLLGPEGTLGVLNLSHPSIGVFSIDHQSVLQLISNHAGIALAHLRLLASLEETNRDLTWRMTGQSKHIRHLEARYARAIAGGRLALWEWEVGSKQVFVAHHLEPVLGRFFERTPRTARAWLRLMEASERRSFMRALKYRFRSGGGSVECRQSLCVGDGSRYDFLVRVEVFVDMAGCPVRVSGSHTVLESDPDFGGH